MAWITNFYGGWAHSKLPLLLCLGGAAVCTLVSFRLNQNLASAGFLYLVFVVLAAVYGGFWQATLISVFSVASLDFFFTEPVFSFRMDQLQDWVELGAFEFTALVISRLSNRAQMRAQEAIAGRRETARLYEVARRILLIDAWPETGSQVVGLIRSEFDLKAVFLFDSLSEHMNESLPAASRIDRHALTKKTRETWVSDLDAFDPAEVTWFRVLRLGTRPVGALALCGAEMSDLSAGALASLAAIALERARALEKQSRAEAERQAEKLRTAVLDALAHKFKTPLTVIQTANVGLSAAGPLSDVQSELVSLVDQEARKLNDLAHRLLGAPDLERSEPEPEPLLLSRLIKSAVRDLEQQADQERFRFDLAGHEPPVLADRELILTAIAQLLDNALKYSLPDSPIDIGVKSREGGVVMTVRSQGLVVSPADRERIFRRFYRAPEAQGCASGTGLGLSIVKTIVNDHHGHVWAEGEPDYGTTFSLSLPALEKALP
jgi:two-component system sensor histidine kinase KdpD